MYKTAYLHASLASGKKNKKSNRAVGDGQTSIHEIVRKADIDALKNVLGSTSGKEVIDSVDALGRTVLHIIAANDVENTGETSPKVIIAMGKQLLQKGANINSRDKEDWTPLHHACILPNIEIASLFLRFNANARLTTREGESPLHFLLRTQPPQGKRDLFVSVLEKLIVKSDLNQVTNRRETVLHYACASTTSWDYAISLVLKSNSSFVNIKNMEGDTCLHLAIMLGRKDILKILLEMGANILIDSLHGSCREIAETYNHKDLLPLIENAVNNSFCLGSIRVIENYSGIPENEEQGLLASASRVNDVSESPRTIPSISQSTYLENLPTKTHSPVTNHKPPQRPLPDVPRLTKSFEGKERFLVSSVFNSTKENVLDATQNLQILDNQENEQYDEEIDHFLSTHPDHFDLIRLNTEIKRRSQSLEKLAQEEDLNALENTTFNQLEEEIAEQSSDDIMVEFGLNSRSFQRARRRKLYFNSDTRVVWNEEPTESNTNEVDKSLLKWVRVSLNHLKNNKFNVDASPDGFSLTRWLDLLPGEILVYHQSNVVHMLLLREQEVGMLYVTNFQIIFRPFTSLKTGTQVELRQKEWSVPLMKIATVQQYLQFTSDDKENEWIPIQFRCKDFQQILIACHSSQCVQLIKELEERILCRNLQKLFAFSLKANVSSDSLDKRNVAEGNVVLYTNKVDSGWELYSPSTEYERQQVFAPQPISSKGSCEEVWRYTLLNAKYNLCRSYPTLLVVPRGISDEELQSISQFRSKGRIPVLVWRGVNGSVILRCSQPKVGITDNRCKEDEDLFAFLHKKLSRVFLFDARPRLNAMANKLKGGGFESMRFYPYCSQRRFLSIGNIHVMREALEKLRKSVLSLILSNCDKRENLLEKIDSSPWLQHISAVLSGAIEIANCVTMTPNTCALVHCSDGWDRTPQVISLASLMADPFYRTLKGFAVLIEKDWLSFSHKFLDRIGHGTISKKPNEKSPVFLQFIDCVWQIWRQFPQAFEFNEAFLQAILYHLYACQCGTFLVNAEYEKQALNLPSNTMSLWTLLWERSALYKNPDFQRTNQFLQPRTDRNNVVFWCDYYLKYLYLDLQEAQN